MANLMPSAQGTNPISLANALVQILAITANIKQKATTDSNLASTVGLSSNTVANWPAYLNSQAALLNTYTALPGMIAFAQAQLNNVVTDITAAYATMFAAGNAVIAVVTGAGGVPVDSSGYVQFMKWGVSGQPAYDLYTPGQLASFISALNALAATIN